jgi:hypothetical protein
MDFETVRFLRIIFGVVFLAAVIVGVIFLVRGMTGGGGPSGGSKVAGPRCSCSTNAAMVSSIGISRVAPAPVRKQRTRSVPLCPQLGFVSS